MKSFKEHHYYKQFIEATEGVIFSFGRFNPPTIGHEENIEELKKLANKYNLRPILFMSWSQDNKKNPLSHKEKADFIKSSIDIEISDNSKLKNAFQILEYYAKEEKIKKLYFVVGEDRVADFDSMKEYAKKWGIEDFRIIESGKRKKGISGTQMREFVKEDDFISFKKYVPKKSKDKDVKKIFDILKSRL